jgi:hypothetical protein
MRTVRANVRDAAARPPAVDANPTPIARSTRVGDAGDDEKTVRIPRSAGGARSIDQSHLAQAIDQSFAARALEPLPSPKVGTPAQPVRAASQNLGTVAPKPHGEGGRPGGESQAAPKPFPGEPQRLDRFAIQEVPDEMGHSTPWWRRRAVAAVLFVGLLASAGVAGRSFFLTPAASAFVPGKLVVNTDPPGIPVVLDGKRSGETPVTLEVAPGEHVLTLLSGETPRTIPVTIASGATVSQFVGSLSR